MTVEAREQGQEVGGMSRRIAAWLAWSMLGLSMALTALSLLLLALTLSHPNVHTFDYWAETTAITVGCSVIGAVIASRSPENPIGWIFCAIGLLSGARHLSAQYAIYTLLAAPGSLPGGEVLAWITPGLWVLYLGHYVFLGLLFPNGRLPSSRWRWVAWLSAGVILTGAISVMFSPGPIDGLGPIRNPLGIDLLGITGASSTEIFSQLLLFILGLLAATPLVVRLRRAGGVERQQIKWIAYAVVVGVGGAILTYTISEAISVSWLGWVGFALIIAGILGVPIAVTIAILKYCLYDIDILINRTLVYGSLTALLAATYFGGVALLQGIASAILQVPFRALTGQETQLATVAATLAIAVLFMPLRRRIQEFIDRRFYRTKYDAQKTLEAFGARVRDEVDLQKLSEMLLEVVDETIKPSHVSLWLREPKKDR